MSSSHNIHGKITKAEAQVLSGSTPSFYIDASDTADRYETTHVCWFPKMEDLPDLVGRLRFMADQLAAIYSKHTAPINQVSLPNKPNMDVLEQKWAEHEDVERCGQAAFFPEGHGQGQCPDCRENPEDA